MLRQEANTEETGAFWKRIDFVHDFYIPLTTEAVMSLSEVVKECYTEKWSPVIVIEYKDRIVVPAFLQHQAAMEFIRRNFGRKILDASGTLGMNEDNFDLFTNKGWEVEIFNFPRKFTERKDVQLAIETFEIPQGFKMPNQGL